jgi:hypothetical protein
METEAFDRTDLLMRYIQSKPSILNEKTVVIEDFEMLNEQGINVKVKSLKLQIEILADDFELLIIPLVSDESENVLN